jgi:hypothetical protein
LILHLGIGSSWWPQALQASPLRFIECGQTIRAAAFPVIKAVMVAARK